MFTHPLNVPPSIGFIKVWQLDTVTYFELWTIGEVDSDM